MNQLECSECPFANSCDEYTQKSKKHSCDYLINLEIIDYSSNGNHAKWTGISMRRYKQSTLEHPLDYMDIDK